MNALAADTLKYKIRSGDSISHVLDDLGTCPLWGNTGFVKRILKENPQINPNSLKKNQILKVSYSYLKRINDVLFLKDGFIVPKNRNSNLCSTWKYPSVAGKKVVTPKPKVKLKSSPILKTGISEYKSETITKESFEIVSIKLSSSDKQKKQSIMQIKVKFNENIKIKGKPKLKIQAKGNLGFASFKKKISSKLLLFEMNYDYDLSKIKTFKVFIPKSLKDFHVTNAKNENILKNPAGYDIPSVFSDEMPPRITDIRIKNKNYSVGDDIIIDVDLSEPVLLKGNLKVGPLLEIELDSGVGKASFVNFLNRYKTIRFTYKVSHMDSAFKGIEVKGAINLRGGVIRDRGGNSLVNNYPNKFFRDAKIIKTKTKVTSIKSPVQKTYKLGDKLVYTLHFNQSVKVLRNPQLKIKVGEKLRYASFVKKLKKKITFSYTIRNNDFDEDGVTLLPELNFMEGQITDIYNEFVERSFFVSDNSGIKVNSGRVFISDLILPEKQGFKSGEIIPITVKFNEKIQVSGDVLLKVKVGNKNKKIKLNKVLNSQSIVFNYLVDDVDNDKILQVVSPLIGSKSVIKNIKGNDADLRFNSIKVKNINIDTKKPEILKIETPEYTKLGYQDKVQILVTFSENVTVVGTPRLKLDFQSGEVYAYYKSGSGQNILKFEYIINEFDKDYLGFKIIGPITSQAKGILDKARNSARLSFDKRRAKAVLIDGSLNYGFISDSRNIKENDKNEISEYQVVYGANFSFGNVKVVGTDLEDDAESALSSSLATGINLFAYQKWNPLWQSEFVLGIKNIKFEEATIREITNTDNTYFTLGLYGKYGLRDSLDFRVGLEGEQLPFIHAQGTRKIIIDPIVSLKAVAGVDWNFYSYASLDLGVDLRYEYLSERTTDNFDLDPGAGYIAKAYISKLQKSSQVRFEVYSRQYKQDSDVFTQVVDEGGIGLSYVFSLDKLPIF
jgi:hypothetical protein